MPGKKTTRPGHTPAPPEVQDRTSLAEHAQRLVLAALVRAGGEACRTRCRRRMPGAVVFGWASTTAGQLPGGGSWPPAVEPGGGYCAATGLDLADRGPGPALLMAWTVNR